MFLILWLYYTNHLFLIVLRNVCVLLILNFLWFHNFFGQAKNFRCKLCLGFTCDATVYWRLPLWILPLFHQCHFSNPLWNHTDTSTPHSQSDEQGCDNKKFENICLTMQSVTNIFVLTAESSNSEEKAKRLPSCVGIAKYLDLFIIIWYNNSAQQNLIFLKHFCKG